ncbi:MAG: hypothetical protein AAGD13_14440 [Pseudomonadota bacterium]
MNAFKFDPYAELAKIQNQTPTPAIVATPATELRPLVETVASVAGIAGSGRECEKLATSASDSATPTPDDPEAYLAYIREHGITTYGVVAMGLRWAASRAWQAEAKLRASGKDQDR